jgi:predicted Rossmann fold nucleotide-binding protein DprA/Smf involved in DNA uptake
MIRYQLDHRDYPEALRELPNPPAVLTASGPLEPRRAIAIVGSRQAGDEARAFAHDLAYQLASAGIVVVSGGAVGVDAAAHRGALEAGGTTWVVSPTGKDRVYPAEHRALFEEIARSEDTASWRRSPRRSSSSRPTTSPAPGTRATGRETSGGRCGR